MRNNYRSARHAFWLASLGVLLYWPVPCSADQTDLLALVRAGHRSAREAIQSFSATVTDEITFTKDPVIVITGHYWRSLDIVRIQEKQGEGTDDYLVKDSEILQVGRGTDPQRGQVRYAAGRRAATEILCAVDVWSLMMIDFVGPNGGRYDFDRFLEFAKDTLKAKREMKDGRNCIRVNLSYVSGNEQNATLWLDVDRNYLVWKKTLTSKGSSDPFESEILEFSEPLPGVFVPIKCRRQSFRGGERNSLEIITLSDVQVNKPIPKSVFQLPAIPLGTILDDRIQRTSYPIDERWRPIGPAKSFVQQAVAGDSESKDSGYHSQSTSEPMPFSRWLILASLFALVIPCTCLLYRQYRLHRRLQRPN